MPIDIITGPMFAGKSSELVRRLRRARRQGKSTQVFKPALDTRDAMISTHDLDKFECDVWRPEAAVVTAQVVGLDEAQFFGPEIVDHVWRWAMENRTVVIAGLDMDFRRQPFGPMPWLLAIADTVTKLKAVCAQCHGDAAYSHRRSGGGERIEVGGQEAYEARCLHCHGT